MKSFRKFLRRMPFYSAYKSLFHYPDYWYWRLRPHPKRSPHLVKQRALLEYAERYGLRTLVETGTYYGEMVAALRNKFDRVDSVESFPTSHARLRASSNRTRTCASSKARARM